MEATTTTKMNGKKKTEEAAAAKPKKGDAVVQGPQLCMAEIPIRGLTELITHQWSEKAKAEMRDKQGHKAKGPKPARDTEAEFEAAKYRTADGKDAIYAGCFRNAIVAAGKFTDKQLPQTRVSAAIWIVDRNIPIKFEECHMREDPVRVGGKGSGTGTASLAYRPGYTNWSCVLRIEFDRSLISVEQLLSLVESAGFRIGICEWRPEKLKGEFGRFEISGNVRIIEKKRTEKKFSVSIAD